jgi:lipopolysaccharide export system permease protein
MPIASVIDRYLIKEILLTLLAVTVVLLLIFISGQLVSLYGKAASGTLQVKSIFYTLGLKSLSNLVFVLPLAFYLAILLSLSRLYKDSEMVVLTACGVSPWRIMRAVLLLAVPFSAMAGWLSLDLAPWAESKSALILEEEKQKGDIESLSSGRFRELTKGEGVVYVQEFDADAVRMKNIFMQYRSKDSNSVIAAEAGSRMIDEKTGDRFLVLHNGQRFEGPDKNGQTAIMDFEEHGVRVVESKVVAKASFRQKAVPTMMLIKRGLGIDHAELQWRVSAVLLCIILAMLAVPLSRTSPRQGRYAKLALALMLYIIYTNLLNVSRAWLNKDEVSIYIGMWWVHIVMLLLALAIFIQWRPVVQRFLNRQ